MGMLLFLRVLQLLSRRFAGKDFRIVPVQRRGKSSFDFVVGKWEKLDSSTVPIPTVRDEHKPESGSEFWNNPRVGIWGEIGLALRGDIEGGLWHGDYTDDEYCGPGLSGYDQNVIQRQLEDGDGPEE